MKKLSSISLIIFITIFFYSCQNKTIELLSQKWDCIKVENLDTGNTKFQNSEDSANAVQLHSVLESLSWTFKNDYQYECAIGSKVTVKGSYGLMDDGKTLLCTPDSKNAINRYTINALTQNDLVLSSIENNPQLVLHFKPH